MSTITVTRTERELLRAQVWRLVPGLHDDPLPFGTRKEAEDSIRRMQVAMSLYDELGWHDQDSRDSFRVTLAEPLVVALREARTDAVSDREHHIAYRDSHVLGLTPTRHGTTWADDFASLDEANAAIARDIAGAEARQRAVGALLARIDAQAVTA